MRQQLFDHFYEDLKTKNEQDSFLAALIVVSPVQRRRSRTPHNHDVASDDECENEGDGVGVNQNSATFCYKVRDGNDETRVSMK